MSDKSDTHRETETKYFFFVPKQGWKKYKMIGSEIMKLILKFAARFVEIDRCQQGMNLA